MEFDWERFKVEDVAVECCNKEEMVDFLNLLKNNGIDEHELKEYLLENNECFKYPIYFEARNYSHNYSVEWCYGTYYQRSNYTMLKWSDYMNCNSINNKELSTKEQLENKIYNIEKELKVAKQLLEELKAKEQLSPRQQFEKDIKRFNIKLSNKDKEKAELREKIYRELTLFAKLNNDECDLEYLKCTNNLVYSMFFDYKHNKIHQISFMDTSNEWVLFKSKEVCKEAIKLFKDDLLKYYNM